MAATSRENGMFVVTQYIPAANPTTAQTGAPKDDAPRFLQTFKKGQPKSLGIVQIMIGVISFLCGVLLYATRFIPLTAVSGVPFVGAILFFISGGLSVSAEKKGTRRLVKVSLVMNILSTIVAGVGVILCLCDLSGDYVGYIYDEYRCRYSAYGCFVYREAFTSYQTGVLAILLLFFLLEFCIAIATSCFGSKSVLVPTSQDVAQHLFVSPNHYTQDPRVLSMQATGVPMAHGVTCREDLPMAFGVTPLPGLPQAQEGTQELPTAPPPEYYRAVPGDYQELHQQF